jgi:alkyl hydroperoxide reductase subunit AhpC
MPLVTSPAPTFDCKAVVGHEIKDVKWNELHEGKWLVLFFYPLSEPRLRLFRWTASSPTWPG